MPRIRVGACEIRGNGRFATTTLRVDDEYSDHDLRSASIECSVDCVFTLAAPAIRQSIRPRRLSRCLEDAARAPVSEKALV